MALSAAEKVKIRNLINYKYIRRGSGEHKTLQEILEHISELSDEQARTLIANWESVCATEAAAEEARNNLGI